MGASNGSFKLLEVKTDTIKAFDQNGEMDAEKMKILTQDIKDMPAVSSLFTDVFAGVGAILSSPAIVDQVIYFGSSDGYIYAISDIK